MAKVRKLLCSLDAPYIKNFMRLIETQSKATLGNWGLSYAEMNILPIYEKSFADDRPRAALASARDWFEGKIKLRDMKNDCHAAAKEAKTNPPAQAAARACAHAVSIAHTPSHSLGVIFYGTAAIVYDRVGTNEMTETYARLAEDECFKMEAALRSIAIENEPNPAKIDWRAFTSGNTLFRRC